MYLAYVSLSFESSYLEQIDSWGQKPAHVLNSLTAASAFATVSSAWSVRLNWSICWFLSIMFW
jgi:hypothetical protein